VYKLVEVAGRPVVKRSENKATVGGRKTAVRRHKPTGTAVEEIVAARCTPPALAHDRDLQRPFVRGGAVLDDVPSLEDARTLLRQNLISIPWEGLKLSAGDPAIPVVLLPAGGSS
jgi:nicotinate phosphoribosyltransferase